MRITISPEAWEHFWVEPPANQREFWAFRFKPKAVVGDNIDFIYEGDVVASATITEIQKPGQCECEATGRFKNLWKVFWSTQSFVDRRRYR